MQIGRSKLKNIYGIDIPVGQYRIKTNPDSYEVYTVKDDTHGCPLLGAVRTNIGIAQCAGVNERLINLLEAAEARNEESWLTVS